MTKWFETEYTVRISSPSHYQGVGKARGTQVDIQSEEKSSSDCVTIYKLIQKLLDHMTLLMGNERTMPTTKSRGLMGLIFLVKGSDKVVQPFRSNP